MNIVTQSQFDETKLNFKQVPQMNNDGSQYTILFNYKFQSGDDQALILTDPIKVRGKGIPQVDGQWKKFDNECLDFFLNLDETDGQLLKTQVIDKIDNKFKHLCGNENSSVNVGNKVIKKLRYTTCHRKIHNGHYNEDEDEDEDDENMISRMKIQLDTVYQPYHQLDIPKEIKTRVFLPIDKNVPINDREFKETPEVVTCLDDVRQLFHYDCTVRLVLKVNRFWIKKTMDDYNKIRQCGITLKCMQIYIVDDPQWFQFHQDKPIIMPGLKIATTTNTKNYLPKYDNKVLIEESDFEVEESELDEEIPINPEKSIYEFSDDDEDTPAKI